MITLIIKILNYHSDPKNLRSIVSYYKFGLIDVSVYGSVNQ